ncbi:MAG: serine protease [Lachnospiraceae bacterium]|nr:serine protease [Lachnospiraceae bacterium]
MVYYNDYDLKYPDLILEILEYFDFQNSDAGEVKDKSVLKFSEQFKEGNTLIYQPTVVNRICKRLCDCGQLECIRSLGGMGLYDNYLFIVRDRAFFEREKSRLKYYYNSMVYGFEYIYRMYKDIVIPLVWDKGNGDYAAGTGFKFLDGVVTAKHCLTDVTNLQIKGYKASELEGKPIYISENKYVDLAFIHTGRIAEPIIYSDDGEIMQEVLVMGYPKIPTFTDFLTAEKATISGKASSRITPTRGRIAAYGYEYLANIDAMLITARIRGGNSGGPVINQNGCLVGIACQIPDANPKNGEYDDMGYGVAVPADNLIDIINRKSKTLEVRQGFFRDFIE